jgi:hypothetical protein
MRETIRNSCEQPKRLWNISDSVVPDNTRAAEWENAVHDFTTQAKSILKREWERVKKGD